MGGKLVYSIIILVITALILGPPDVLNLGLFSWNFQKEPNEKDYPSEVTITKTFPKVLVHDALKIENLTSEKSIYNLGSNATIHFIIKDDFNFNYNLTIYWIKNGEIIEGWSTQNSSTQSFYSWYIINQRGEWKAQVDLYWRYENKTYTTDKITEFSVY